MPRPIFDNRETEDLHAPWWSAERDASGRYKERWVVKRYMTERDQQRIAQQQEGRVRSLSSGKSRKELAADMMAEVVQNQIPFARLYLLLEMTVQITDETGQPLHLSKDVLSAFPTRDTEWVADELEKLYGAPDTEDGGVVPVLDQDVFAAERAASASEAGVTVDDADLLAEGHAVTRFRRSGRDGVAGHEAE